MMTQVYASLSFSWCPKWKHDSLCRPPPVQRTSLCLVPSTGCHAQNFGKAFLKARPLPFQQRNNVVSLMASMNVQRNSSIKEFQWKYDVFLSFRGEDTRKNFTDHLYVALHKKGIVTYRDDPNLEKGDNISNEVLKAIENSKFLVVILSKNYASSTWCLEELAKIVECMRGGEQKAIPIFYKVDPSDVRKQRGSFHSAFAKHEVTFKDDMVKVQRWKKAMEEIANLAGWDLLDRHESHFIRDIITDLKNKLHKKLSYAPKNLVGIESRMKDVFSHLSLGSNDVRFIGISGMGGIGKSTLARAIFDEISVQFEGCSFLANIREVSDTHGMVHLQNKLLFDVLQENDLVKDVIAGVGTIEECLKCKSILVVLDDVDQIQQLQYLAGKSWFGLRSRIIITTRDEHLLLKHGVNAIYKAKKLSNDEALELFCSKALRENNLETEFTNLSKQVIGYANGLPLALTVLGSYLLGRTVVQWQSTLARLQESPNKQIFETLRLSFDKLEETEKEIFLDIACFFNGEDKDCVMKILDFCGFHPNIGVEVLVERSLLTITDNKFMVHDLLQEMAREIVRQESPKEPGKRSRLWLYDDFCHIMTNNTGTERVEGIVLKPRQRVHLKADSFNKMTNLRLLVIRDAFNKIEYLRLFVTRDAPDLSEVKLLPNSLRLLTWDFFPESHLPVNFLPENLHELNLRGSHLRQVWTAKKIFHKLKNVDLSGSTYLMETPDFKMVPNLEKLILRRCAKLTQIHHSIGVLHNLEFLDLSFCENLTKLPSSISSLRSLKVLRLKGCSKLEELPESICSFQYLEELDVSETTIAYLPPNLRNLNHQKKLSYGTRNARGMLLPSLSWFSSLEELDMSNCCVKEGGIPNILGCLSSLRKLDLSGNYFYTIPKSINQIPKLQSLKLFNCWNLQALPRLPESIIYVRFSGCSQLKSISNLFIVYSESDSYDDFFFNCLKFVPEDLKIPLAQKYFLALFYYILCCSRFPDIFVETYVVAPRCEIPKWFTYREDGSMLSFRIIDPCFKCEVCGFTVWVSFLRDESDDNVSTYMECCYDLVCEFYVGKNQLGPSFHFPIRYLPSNCLWMGFVPLKLFQDRVCWTSVIDKRIDVSLRTMDDKLKVIKCGILPLKVQTRHTIKKFIQSASSFPEDFSSIFHKVVYQEVDYPFSSSGDNKEKKDNHEFPRDVKTCGVSHSIRARYLGTILCDFPNSAL